MLQHKLGGHMALAVEGIDLSRATAETQTALIGALHDNLVLCIRGQALGPVAFRDAMARFGRPVKRLQLAATPECDEVNIISSEDRDELGDGKKLVNGASWHTDDSFMRQPCSLTMLYGVTVPSRGGDTQFVNMYAAYEALSPEMK
ncbi:MAG TPA: TauD/TfdA family dioxygenase, partial [Reyranella sp.]|nr:TauD/TfdA family dioxygenase [Reyranella sp.]